MDSSFLFRMTLLRQPLFMTGNTVYEASLIFDSFGKAFKIN